MPIINIDGVVYDILKIDVPFKPNLKRKKILPVESINHLFLQEHIKNRSTDVTVEIVELDDDYVIAYEQNGTAHMITEKTLHLWCKMQHHRMYEPWFDYDSFGKLIRRKQG